MKVESRPNPFVGPGPIGPGKDIFGRDDEIEKLTELINSERIVFLHSPSGAGKTSIINAGLIPRLQNEDFEVLPVARLSLAYQNGLPVRSNRYIAALIGSLGDRLGDAAARVDGTDLQDLLLRTFEKIISKGRFPCLVFDQFEEVITLDPTDWNLKRQFFRFLANILSDGRIWALFAAREDFVSSITALAQVLPTRFQTNFRLDFLKRERAKEAIIQTARTGGITFGEETAGVLVKDLATIEVQTIDGKFHSAVGESVEPLHLQLVCKRICDLLGAEETTVDGKVLGVPENRRQEARGSVSKALQDYYREEVTAAAGGSLTRERRIREWFRDQLLSDLNVRVPVLMQPEETEGLENKIIERLGDAYLVRVDYRANSIWYELSHDRLICPVIADNSEWFKQHPKPLEEQYREWIRSGRNEALLLRGKDLRRALREQRTTEFKYSPQEIEFLIHSKELRTRNRWRLLLPIAITLGCIAIAYVAIQQLKNLELQAKNAELDRAINQLKVLNHELDERDQEAKLLNQAYKNSGLSDPDTSVLYFAHILNKFRHVQAHDKLGHENFLDPLGSALDKRGSLVGTLRMTEEGAAGGTELKLAPVWAIAYSPDASLLATGGGDRTLRIWRAGSDVNKNGIPIYSEKLGGRIWSVAWNADGQELAVASSVGVFIFVRSITDGGIKSFELLDGSSQSLGYVWSVSWNPHGGLAAGCKSGKTYVWPAAQFDPSQSIGRIASLVRDAKDPVFSVCWNPEGTLLAMGDETGKLEFWNGSTLLEPSSQEQHGPIWAMAWSTQGKLAAGSWDKTIAIWETISTNPTAPPEFATKLRAHDDRIRTLTWTPDGNVLVSGADDGQVKIWSYVKPELVLKQTRVGAYNEVAGLAYNPTAEQFAVGSEDGCVRIYPVKEKTAWLSGNNVIWLCFEAGTKEVLSLDRDGSLYALTPELQEIRHAELHSQVGIQFACKEPGGSGLAVVYYPEPARHLVNLLESQHVSGAVELRDISGQYIKGLSVDDAVTAIAWRPGTKTVFFGTGHGGLFAWNTAARYEVERITNLKPANNRRNGAVTALSWDQSGRYLFAAENSDDPKVTPQGEVFDFQNGRVRSLFQKNVSNSISSSAWNKDASLLALGLVDGNAGVLEISSKQYSSVVAHGRTVRALSWMDDGTLVTGGEDGFVRVWGITSDGLMLRRSFKEHTNAVLALAVDPSGANIWSGGSDHRIIAVPSWRYTYDGLWEYAKRAVNRNMTQLEWQNFDRTHRYERTFEGLPVPN